jgi:hypothetical protein
VLTQYGASQALTSTEPVPVRYWCFVVITVVLVSGNSARPAIVGFVVAKEKDYQKLVITH